MIRIAVIDDDPIELTLLKGFSAHLSGLYDWQGFESVESFASRDDAAQFDLVFLDRKIPPFVRFVDTVPIIEASGFTGRIVLLSAHSDEQAPTSSMCEILGPYDKIAVQDRSQLEGLLQLPL